MKSKCFAKHCSHCRGGAAPCVCQYGCSRPYLSRCFGGGGGGFSQDNAEDPGPSYPIAPAAGTPAVSLAVQRINLVLVVDKSGSMSGARWDSVQRGVLDAVSELTSTDVVTVVMFNERLDVLGPAPKAALDLTPFRYARPGGGTALYDAIMAALTAALPLHAAVDRTSDIMDCATYIVVLTDGEDTDSRTSLSDVESALRQINRLRGFKVLIGGVDLPPAGRAAIRRMVAIGDSDISFHDLRGGFGGIFEHIRVSLHARR